MARHGKSGNKGMGAPRRTNARGGAPRPEEGAGESTAAAAIPALPSDVIEAEVITLRGRVEHVTRALLDLNRARRPASQRMAFEEAAVARDEPTTTIKFTKTSGPKHVRITLSDTGERVLDDEQEKGESRPRRIGAVIDATIVVDGNPGETASIKVENALPEEIAMDPDEGGTGSGGTRRLTVTG